MEITKHDLESIFEAKLAKFKAEIQQNIVEKIEEERENELLTHEEAALLLNVSENTLHRWRKNGKIEAQRIGRRYLYQRKMIFEKAREGIKYQHQY